MLFAAVATVASLGCSGGQVAPTKIYEGGGTAPEVVDQPEKPAPGAKNKSPRK